LIGVVDLRHGVPVHAVAGERHRYAPRHEGGQPLRAAELIEHYRRRGVRRFYVADLDGIIDGHPCWDLHRQLAEGLSQNEHLLIDAGWRGTETESEVRPIRETIAKHSDQIAFVAAAESAVTRESPSTLAKAIGANRVWLGFDYRLGRWVGGNGSEPSWTRAAEKEGYAGIVVLDLATVGTAGGPTTEPIIRRLKTALPNVAVLSGGGIRDNADVEELVAAGANGCLVATALMNR